MKCLATLKILAIGLIAAAGLSLQPAVASVTPSYSFSKITSNSTSDIGNQLSMDVSETSNGAVFTFHNNIGVASSVAKIYFDDSGLLGSMGLGGYSDVSYFPLSLPSVLPGGAAYSFSTDYAFQATPPPPKHGLSAAGDWVSFVGYWANGANFNSLLDAIAAGEFRVGMHVINIGGSNGVSDSYISSVPLPAAAWLFGSALIGFVTLSNRRRI